MPSGDPVSVEVTKALDEVGITEGDLAALSIHGPAALNDFSKSNKLLAVLEDGGQLRFHGVEGSKLIDLVLVVGLKQLREDCLEEKLGGAVASQLLIPYRPLANERLLRRLERHNLVISKWVTEGGGPAKRIYYITEEGLTYLSESIEKLRRVKLLIDMLISSQGDA